MSSQAFGKYQLLKKLATGGMAEVWLARQTGIEGFNRHVVVKRILPHLAEDPEFIQMFLNEAKIAARFNHPNIGQIFDLGEKDGQYFIAMEYVHGEDLGRVMRRAWSTGQWVARPVALRIISDACQGLYYAHTRADEAGRPLRVVHRDISPQNIIISFDGSVKLVDFGIAKAADSASNTKSGAIKGKFAYMAPEQAAGRALDARTDLFALGLVLYELLTGVRPLKRDAELATLQAALESQIEAPSLVADVPPEVDAVVMKALAKSPDERYRDARQMHLAIEAHLVQEAQIASSVQVSQLMEQLFADRLAEEARTGAINPTNSVTNHPASAEDLQPLTADGVSPLLEEPSGDPDGGPTEAIRADDVPKDVVVPSRRYATQAGEPRAGPAQRRHTAAVPPPRRKATPSTTDAEYESGPHPVPPRRQSNPGLRRQSGQGKPRPSQGRLDAVGKQPPSEPRPNPTTEDRIATRPEASPFSNSFLGAASRQDQLKKWSALGGGVLLVLLLALIVAPKLLGGRSSGTPVSLTVISNPRTRVTVVPPVSASNREPLDLGETPRNAVSGAYVGDTVVLSNVERGIRYEEQIERLPENAPKLIEKEFREGTVKIRTSPTVRGGEVYRGSMKIGAVGMPMKLFEGVHRLEIHADDVLKFPVEFEVRLLPNQVVEQVVDLTPAMGGAGKK